MSKVLSSQRRSFFYWLDVPNKNVKKLLSKKTTPVSRYTATYPNAQELPDSTFSFHQRKRDVLMLHDKYHNAAQTALLQFNVMIRQKVKPNVKTYTSLIAVMAKAKMELTAFKLFNRMLQQNITPMPETYQALLEATSPMRAGLISEIQRKLHQSVQTYSRHLVKRRKQLQIEARTASVEYLKELTTDDPEKVAEMNLQKELERLHVGTTALMNPDAVSDEPVDPDSPNATIYVSSLRKAFYGNAWDAAGRNQLTVRQRADLRPQLNRLSDMELQMFLTIHRQGKTESREQNIEVILEKVQEGFIYEMLKQREDYLNTLKEIMAKNEALAEHVRPFAEDGLEEMQVESYDVDAKQPRRRVKTIKRQRKKKNQAAGGPQEDASEEQVDHPHQQGPAPSAFDNTVVTEVLAGCVQEGIQLRGTYDINYVKLANEGKLWGLSIKQLKAFEYGESFSSFNLTKRGTKAEHIDRIEAYLFGTASQKTSDALQPRLQKPRGFLDMRDKSDEEGNREEDQGDRDITALAAMTPYTTRAKTVRYFEAAGGRSAKIVIPHINNPNAAESRRLHGVMKLRIAVRERKVLSHLARMTFRESRENRDMRMYVENKRDDEQSNHPQKKARKYGALWQKHSQTVKSVKKDYERQLAKRSELLSPLRDYAQQMRSNRKRQEAAEPWSRL